MSASDWSDDESPPTVETLWLWSRFVEELKAAEWCFAQLTGMEMPHRFSETEARMFAAEQKSGRPLLSEARRRIGLAHERLQALWGCWPEKREALNAFELALMAFTEWIGVVGRTEAAAKSGTLRPQDLPDIARHNADCAKRMGKLVNEGLRALGKSYRFDALSSWSSRPH